ncbi:hypothetical protein AVEN_41558-1 [Araneus ventricosus]|uniref:Uncharacterized protein n=1 Tax=Araneus ventricosus TaxID=182803 RepID=A0A4Y2RCE4_ARAVE|nr:hypothetical protein AVEN_41558-1 [Araneus ventricosus]
MLSKALELRFGKKCPKDYSHLQLKARRQRPNETLRKLATDVETLSHIAFFDSPNEVRETLPIQYFIDGVRYRNSTSSTNGVIKRLDAGLVCAMKFEVSEQGTKRYRHATRGSTFNISRILPL